jgi:hypothetical protein
VSAEAERDGAIAAFISARLDEIEATATAAADYGANWRLADPDRSSAIESDRDGLDRIVVYDEGAPTIEQATHIVRHDPARVLREVEAKRHLVGAVTETIGGVSEPWRMT